MTGDNGFCEWAPRAGAPEIPAQVFLLAALAGPAADRCLSNYEPDAGGGDYQDARSAARRHSYEFGGDIEVVLRQGEREARTLVIAHEKAIRKLAEILVNRRELDGRTVARILQAEGVQRENAGGGYPSKGAAEISRQRLPIGAPAMSYERRDGRTVATRDPDPRRQTFITLHRTDGHIR